jgi:hypothetical protein
MRISNTDALILHDFPFEVALEPRKSECAGARTGMIGV